MNRGMLRYLGDKLLNGAVVFIAIAAVKLLIG